MNNSVRRFSALAFVALLAGVTACSQGGGDVASGAMQQGSAGPIPEGAEMPSNHPPISQLPSNHPNLPGSGGTQSGFQEPGPDARTGTVLEVLSAGGYTYARMVFEGDEIWVAGPPAPLEEGDEVTISGIMGMNDFYARSLDRTFDQILFASVFTRG